MQDERSVCRDQEGVALERDLRSLRVVEQTNGLRLSDVALQQLQDLFASAPGPSTVVFEVFAQDGSAAVVQSQKKIRVSPEFLAAVQRVCGDDSIQRVS